MKTISWWKYWSLKRKLTRGKQRSLQWQQQIIQSLDQLEKSQMPAMVTGPGLTIKDQSLKDWMEQNLSDQYLISERILLTLEEKLTSLDTLYQQRKLNPPSETTSPEQESEQ